MVGPSRIPGYLSTLVRTAGCALAIGLASCSPANEAPGSTSSASSTGSGIIGCASDPRADTYSAGLRKFGTGKALAFVLVGANPAPPAINDNTWTVEVLDSTGATTSSATISAIKTWMPDHGHGSPETPVATPDADGTFTVQPLDLFMNGLWQVTFTAQVGSVSDSATFSFCIGG